MNRPGLRVAARRGYASPRGQNTEERKRDEEARRAREARRPNADKTSAQLRDMLNSPMQQSGLNFTVQAAPFKNTPKEASVALAIELDGNRLPYSPPNDERPRGEQDRDVVLGVNELGKAVGGTRTELDLTLRPETRERVTANGVRINPRMNLPPGRYQLRSGREKSSAGLTGTVFYDLDGA